MTSASWTNLMQRRSLPWILALLSVALCARSLFLGRHADDHMHRAILTHAPDYPDLARAPWDVFSFIEGDRLVNRQSLERGLLPWWANLDLRLSFLRPLTSLTHWIDYRLWPDRPWLMHAQSLLWLGLAVAGAAFLYRRLLPPIAAGLAALLFAVDEAHALPAMWLANRNILVAAFFGALTLIFHDRWRREGWSVGGVLAPAALLCALLATEAGMAVSAYILCYALFVERGRWTKRLAAAAPAILVCVVWMLAYSGLGYGAQGSGLYVDPVRDPLRFLAALGERLPLLLWGQLGLPSDLFFLFSADWYRKGWVVVVALLVALAWGFFQVLRHDRDARFWGTALLLSTLPAAATFPSDRLLILSGWAAKALVAAFLIGVRRRTAAGGGWTFARGMAWTLVAVHLLLAPLNLLSSPANMAAFRDDIQESAETFPSDDAVGSQQVLIVNTPSSFVTMFAPLIQALEGRRVPERMLILGSCVCRLEIARPEPARLILKAGGGFLLGRPDPATSKPVARVNAYPLFDLLFTDRTEAWFGRRRVLKGLTVEILRTTEDGRPLEVAFQFDRQLEDPSLRWVRWEQGRYVAFQPPPVGSGTTLDPPTLSNGDPF